MAFLLLIQHKAIAIYIARTSHILSPEQPAHLEMLTAVPIIPPLAMAVFVLVAAALCQHTPAPPTAERTKMGQDLGQTKALTEKETGEIFTGQLSLFQIYSMAPHATAVVQVGEFPGVLLIS